MPNTSGAVINIKQEPLDLPAENEEEINDEGRLGHAINIKAEPPDDYSEYTEEAIEDDALSEDFSSTTENAGGSFMADPWPMVKMELDTQPTMYVSKDQLPIEFQNSDDEVGIVHSDPEPEGDRE